MTFLSLLIFCHHQADTHLSSYCDVSRPESTAPVSDKKRRCRHGSSTSAQW